MIPLSVFFFIFYIWLLIFVFLDAEKLWFPLPACQIGCFSIFFPAEWRLLASSLAAVKAVKHGCRLLFDHHRHGLLFASTLHIFWPFPTYLIIYQHSPSKLVFPCPFGSSYWRKLNPSSVTSWFKWLSDLNDWFLWSVSVRLQSASSY